jgi:multidrug transporter EmrE-like cation transporter
MNKKQFAVLMVLFATIFNSVGQIFWKSGADKLSVVDGFLPVFIGFVFYGLGAVAFLGSLKYLDLSYAYPLIALTYIWVSFLSPIFFNDSMNFIKWGGVCLVFVGVSLIGFGSEK